MRDKDGKFYVDLDNPENNELGSTFDFGIELPDLLPPTPVIDPSIFRLRTDRDNDLSYNPDRGVLKIKGESVKFTLDKKPANILAVLFSDDLKREWSWDEIIEAWGEEPETYSSKYTAAEMIMSTGKNINAKVAAETSNKKFLIVTSKKIKINPKYIV